MLSYLTFKKLWIGGWCLVALVFYLRAAHIHAGSLIDTKEEVKTRRKKHGLD